MGFALLGLLISLNTSVLKTITDNQDKAKAKAEDDQRKQAAAFERLADQQREEAQEQRRRDEALTQERHLAEVAQADRDNALAQQQRDLSLSQQQLEGFNKAERLTREQTLAELQRANKILFNVNRGQYPITADLKITPYITVSINHPLLKDYATRIKNRANEILEFADRNSRYYGEMPNGERFNIAMRRDTAELVLDRDSSLLPPEGTPARRMLTNVAINFLFFARDNPVFGSQADLSFYYYGDVFSKENNYAYKLVYRPNDSSFGIIGPALSPSNVWGATGKIISYLDLAGSTLLMLYGNSEISRFECDESMRIDEILVTTPSSLQLEIPSKRDRDSSGSPIGCLRVSAGEQHLAYKFNLNVDKFLETYGRHK